MPLPAGYRLGPYEVLSPLGTGGMGEVYRAKDSRLGREVAIKILPEAFAADAERVKRFEREARAASLLEHPNIVTIHEINDTGGRLFLVMERIQGRTLRELLAVGPLPARQAVQIAAQVADGLARAHESGIVHRDVKPENVMITKEGLAKILDFGLSKLTHPEGEQASLSEGPTASLGTEAGVVMGTVAYMSPEQASGQGADFHSDQFSLGSMLYEMVAGRRAFDRQTKAETLAAIIRDEPNPIVSLRPQTPPPVRWIIERCLNKNPELRYVSTRDLARELAILRDDFSAMAAQTAQPEEQQHWRRRSLNRVLLGLGVMAGVFLFALFLGRRSEQTPPSFHRLTFRRGNVWSARFAPDGKTIIYGAAWDGEPVRLFSTRPENPESLPLSLPVADILSISPKGEMAISLGRHFAVDWLTYGRLARVPLSGTAPREILERVLAADWSPAGDALSIVRDIGGRTRLEFPIGRVLYETKGWITNPRVSPKGKLVAFMEHPLRWGDGGDVAVVDLSGKKTTLSAGWGSNQGLAWTPDGDEVWFTASKSWFARDLYAATPSGKIRIVARLGDNLTLHDVSPERRVLLSRDRVRAGMVGRFPNQPKERDLSWLDLSIVADLSSDGKHALFHQMAAGESPPAVCIRNTDGSPPVRLGDGFPTALSSDGKWVLGVTDRLTLLPTGTGEARSLERGKIQDYFWAGFAPPNRILSAGSEEGHGIRLYVQEENGGPRPISGEGIDVEFAEIAISHAGSHAAAISPDHRIRLYPTNGGDPLEAPGTIEGDVPVQWSSDDSSLFVFEREKLPAPIFRIDLSTGRRQPLTELMPSDPAGVNVFLCVRMTPDGRFYVYSYGQVLSELNLVDGLK